MTIEKADSTDDILEQLQGRCGDLADDAAVPVTAGELRVLHERIEGLDAEEDEDEVGGLRERVDELEDELVEEKEASRELLHELVEAHRTLQDAKGERRDAALRRLTRAWGEAYRVLGLLVQPKEPA